MHRQVTRKLFQYSTVTRRVLEGYQEAKRVSEVSLELLEVSGQDRRSEGNLETGTKTRENECE